MKKFIVFLIVAITVSGVYSQDEKNDKGSINTNKFRQFKSEWATPNDQRTASGAPGHNYKQQKVDYIINIKLDEKNNKILGQEKITYHNNSNDHLEYLWLQLDQNMRAPDSKTKLLTSEKSNKFTKPIELLKVKDKEFGFNIENVTTKTGNSLSHTVNGTMMRINLNKIWNDRCCHSRDRAQFLPYDYKL